MNDRIGVVVRITFANAAATYIVQEFNSDNCFSYIGKDWRTLEFSLYDGVYFETIFPSRYVSKIRKISLHGVDPPQISSDGELNTHTENEIE